MPEKKLLKHLFFLTLFLCLQGFLTHLLDFQGYSTRSVQAATVELLTGASQSCRNNQYAPHNTYYMDSIWQSIYLKSDLNNAGINGESTISQVCFNICEIPGRQINSFRIKMKNTSASSLSAFDSTGLTIVYGPNSYNVTTTGWRCHTLSQPFTWDGNSNLLIEAYRNDSAWTAGGGNYIRNTSSGRSYAGYCDNCSGCGVGQDCYSPTTRNAQSSVLSVQLTYESGGSGGDSGCSTVGGVINANCAWTNDFGINILNGNIIRGVDETVDGQTNSGSIRVEAGATVTIGSHDTVVVGEIDMSGESGQIVLIEGGEIKPGGAVWYETESCDTTPVISEIKPFGYVHSSECITCSALAENCSVGGDCCSGNCVDGVCCNSASCSGCRSCNVAGSAGYCADDNSQCIDSGWNGCSGSCVKTKSNSGICSSGSCTTASAYVSAGYVCSGGSEVASTCSTGSWSCFGDCRRRRYEYACNGSGSCSYNLGYTYSNISAGNVCSGGSESSVGFCGYSDWNGCAGDQGMCIKSRDALKCGGTGSCNYASGSKNYANVSAGKICSGGSEIDGLCSSNPMCDGNSACTGASCDGSNSCSYGVGCTACDSLSQNCTAGACEFIEQPIVCTAERMCELMNQCWGTSYPTWGDCYRHDYNGDGKIDLSDIMLTIGNGHCFPPVCTDSNFGCPGCDLCITGEYCDDFGDSCASNSYSFTYGGDTYTSVAVGDQCWLAENMNIDPNSADNPDCTGTKYCYQNSFSNCNVYGGLYNWDDATCGSTNQGICPDGWRMPSHSQLDTLKDSVCGASGHEGAALAGNASLWNSGSLTNSSSFGCSGFDLLPGGKRSSESYSSLGEWAYIWSSTEYSDTNARARNIPYSSTSFQSTFPAKYWHFSVRCIKQ